MPTLEKNISGKVLGEVDTVITTVKTGKHKAILCSIEFFVMPRMEFAIRSSSNAFSTRDFNSVLLHHDQKVLARKTASLRFTASSRFNLNTNLNRIDDTRGNIKDEAGDLSVSEREFDCQTHKNHDAKSISLTISFHIFLRMRPA